MKDEGRLKILEKIDEYERAEKWHCDVEDDPETIPLTPDKVDYLNKKFSSRVMNKVANYLAIRHFEKMIKNNQFIIKEIRGLENYRAVKGGAMLTCNHFNPCDNYAVFRAIRKDLGKRNLYKVIREGNYTNFPGFYGLLFRNCNTLPLSSNTDTMKKFISALSVLLKRGEKVLIYPEQGMWWNYKKPRPLQSGAFNFAVTNGVPIIPVFITMQDSEYMDGYGFPVQEYTLHFLPAIYPDKALSKKEQIEKMKNQNYEAWKNVYEKEYGVKLEYLQKEE